MYHDNRDSPLVTNGKNTWFYDPYCMGYAIANNSSP